MGDRGSISACPLCGTEVQSRYVRCPECDAACWLERKEARADLIARIHLSDESVDTEELLKIEYLLEALDEAREWGELPDASYRLLTRRYLERAHELGQEYDEDEDETDNEEDSVETAPAAAPDRSVTEPQSVYDEWTGQATPPTPPIPGFPSPWPTMPQPAPAWSPPLGQPREPRPPSRVAAAARDVPWTIWVALVGALLVVAAAAGFAIYAWPSLAMGIRLGILVAVTAVFYAGGLWLRHRLAVIGISLLAVGASLVLIDGWFLISAGHLRSLWWWALLFAVGSAVHWGMGAWLHARVFAFSGTLAQIAWWWLLGTALSWPLGARAAILTTVGLIWTLSASQVRPEAAQSIGELLGLAGPGLAACASVVAVVGGLVDPGWGAVIAALVTAVTATAALQLQKVVEGTWVREASVVAFLPVPVAFLALPDGPAWAAIVLMVVCGAVALLLSARRGGHLRALAGLFTVLAAPCMPALLGTGGRGVWIGAVASWLALGALGVVGGSLLPGRGLRYLEKGLPDTCRVLHAGGWVVLLGASLLQVTALGVAEPLMAGELPSNGALTLLAAEAAAAWLVATGARSKLARPASGSVVQPSIVLLTVAGLIGYAYSQFAAALAVRWIEPGADHVWYSIVLLVLAAAWSHARTLPMRRLFGMSSLVAAWMFGVSSVASVLFSVAPALFRSNAPSLGIVLLAALAAVLWLLEVWRFGERAFTMAASFALSVTVYLAAWKIDDHTAAGLATAVATLVLLPLPAVLSDLPLPASLRGGDARSRTWWTAPSLAAGLVATATLAPKPGLATVGLLVLAVAALAGHLAERFHPASPEQRRAWSNWLADAGVACAVLAVVVALFPMARHAGGPEFALAWGVAAVGSLVFEVWGRLRPRRIAVETGVVVLLPLLVWNVAMIEDGPVWTGAAGLGSAIAVLAFAWWRGGHSRVVAGSVLLVIDLPLLLVRTFGVGASENRALLAFGTGLFLGLVVLLMSLWVLVAAGTMSRWRGAHDVRRVFTVEAWLFFAVSTAGIALVHEASWHWADPRPVSPTVLCAFALLVWLAAAAVRWHVESRRRSAQQRGQFTLARDTAPAVVSYALTLYLAAVLERWIRPEVSLAWIAAAIFTAGLVWSRLRGSARRLLGCPETVVETMWAATSGVLALVVLIAAVSRHGAPDPSAGVLLAMVGLAWCAEMARFGRPQFMPAASMAFAAATGLVTWSVSSGAAGGLAAAVAGVVLALAPLALRRDVEWRLWWSLGAAFAALMGVVGAGFEPWSATLALAALAAALAGPALLGLPVFAGASSFAAFAAVCSLEHWAGANAWVGTIVAVGASALMLAPRVIRRGRPRPALGAESSLAVAGALALIGMLLATGVASIVGEVVHTTPNWLSGGAWSLAALLLALAAYCAGWSLSDRTRWGLVTGAALLLAGLLAVLGAARVGMPEAYFTVTAVWCVAVAWLLSRGDGHRRATLALDIVALVVGLLCTALLMIFSGFGEHSAIHAIWLIGLAAAMVGAGVGLRVRLYFGCGLGGVVLAALWLTSSHLSVIPAVVTVVAIVGGALITLGAVGERRRARLTQAAKNAFSGWR